MSHESPESMNPNALPIDVAARMLSKAGARQSTDAMIREDVDAGAKSSAAGCKVIRTASASVHSIATWPTSVYP